MDRAVEFLIELSDHKFGDQYADIRDAIYNMEVMPSMRLLAMAGEAARRTNVSIYNCSYSEVDSTDAFVESLLNSMSGCGVGYSVESRCVNLLPTVKHQAGLLSHLVIEDTTEGWANALRSGLTAWFNGEDITFDYSLIRPMGAILRVKGGRASGPEPLKDLMDFTRRTILSAQGRKLRPLEAHDIMCKIGDASIMGGSRRTALIALFDIWDQEMANCKHPDNIAGNEQRWNANNSAVWTSVMDRDEVSSFMDVMFDGGVGEPGIFNRLAAEATKPIHRKSAIWGTNPCVTGDTWVMTESGARRVNELLSNKQCLYVDGDLWDTTADGFFETGEKEVFTIETKEGYALTLTSNHPVFVDGVGWKDAGSLNVGEKIRLHSHNGASWGGNGTYEDGWLLGMLVGNGTFGGNTAYLDFWGETKDEMMQYAIGLLKDSVSFRSDMKGYVSDQLDRARVGSVGLKNLASLYGVEHGNKTAATDEIEKASSEFYKGFLRGFFDADGSVCGDHEKGLSVRLSQVNKDSLKAVQRMLLRLGIPSVIYCDRKDACVKMMPDGHGGEKPYECQSLHELVISNGAMFTFRDRVGFQKPDKKAKLDEKLSYYKRSPNRSKFTCTVKSLINAGVQPVYDCSVPGVNAFDANGMYVHNCGEILLRSNEFCNLSVAVARHSDTVRSLARKVKLATLIGTIQSNATHFPGLRPVWASNCQDERLLGVDITGQMDSPIVRNAANLLHLRDVAVAANREYADVLGINHSASVTCVKPSGNSSQLIDCSSGIHARWSPYYIRNVRVMASSPIYKMLKDQNVPMSPENGQTPDNARTWVIHFPIAAPKGAITKNDLTAIQQCDYWKMVKLNWTTHNPSVTITYKDHEKSELVDWVHENQKIIGGMSFLPHSDAKYNLAPYQEIDETEYARLTAEFPKIDFRQLYKYEDSDMTTSAQEIACVAGNCDL